MARSIPRKELAGPFCCVGKQKRGTGPESCRIRSGASPLRKISHDPDKALRYGYTGALGLWRVAGQEQ